MLYIQSTNANDGTMNQAVTFDVGTNIDIDNVLVQNRFSQAQTVPAPGRQELRRHHQEVAGVPADRRLALLARRALRRLVPRPTTRPSTSTTRSCASSGVGDIRNLGASDYAMRVWLKPDVLARLGPDGHRRRRTPSARRTSSTRPARSAPSRRRPGSSSRTPCARRGAWSTPEEFGDVIVRENPDGSLVRVRDVAAHRAGLAQLQRSTARSTASRPASSPPSSCPARTRSTSPQPCARRWPSSRSASRRAWTTRSRSTPRRR